MSLFSFAQQKQVVTAKVAPKAVGPYSQAVKAGGFVFTAGQLPLDPASGLLTGTNIESAGFLRSLAHHLYRRPPRPPLPPPPTLSRPRDEKFRACLPCSYPLKAPERTPL